MTKLLTAYYRVSLFYKNTFEGEYCFSNVWCAALCTRKSPRVEGLDSWPGRYLSEALRGVLAAAH